MQQIHAQATLVVTYDTTAFEGDTQRIADTTSQHLKRKLEGAITEGLLIRDLKGAEVEDLSYTVQTKADADAQTIHLDLDLDLEVTYDYVTHPAHTVKAAIANIFRGISANGSLSPDPTLIVYYWDLKNQWVSEQPSSDLRKNQMAGLIIS